MNVFGHLRAKLDWSADDDIGLLQDFLPKSEHVAFLYMYTLGPTRFIQLLDLALLI